MPELVTVRRYRDLSEAIVARSLLESCGITVYLYDENLVRLDWQISNFIGGIRLQVEQSAAADAGEILSAPVPAEIEYGPAEDQGFEQPLCPRCGSAEISCDGPSRGAALSLLYLAAVPWPQGGRARWTCAACGLRWHGEGAD